MVRHPGGAAHRARAAPARDLAAEDTGMTFAHTWLLAFLPLVPMVLVFWAWSMERARRRARVFSRTSPPGPPYLAAALLGVAAAAAIVAAAQPRWGEREQLITREGAQVMIVLDV